MIGGVDLEALKIRTKPFSDKDGYQPICNRCMNANSLINSNGDFCTVCGHPFIRNLIGFDTLPLVEFAPDVNIAQNEIMALLNEETDAPAS